MIKQMFKRSRLLFVALAIAMVATMMVPVLAQADEATDNINAQATEYTPSLKEITFAGETKSYEGISPYGEPLWYMEFALPLGTDISEMTAEYVFRDDMGTITVDSDPFPILDTQFPSELKVTVGDGAEAYTETYMVYIQWEVPISSDSEFTWYGSGTADIMVNWLIPTYPNPPYVYARDILIQLIGGTPDDILMEGVEFSVAPSADGTSSVISINEAYLKTLGEGAYTYYLRFQTPGTPYITEYAYFGVYVDLSAEVEPVPVTEVANEPWTGTGNVDIAIDAPLSWFTKKLTLASDGSVLQLGTDYTFTESSDIVVAAEGASGGGFTVNFQESYLKTLSPGEYIYNLELNEEGLKTFSDVNLVLNIEDEEAATTGTSTVPATGDNAGLMAVVTGLALAAGAGITVFSRRRVTRQN